jgi:hypothetical protein
MKLKITIKKTTVSFFCFAVFAVLFVIFIVSCFYNGTCEAVPVVSVIIAIMTAIIACLTYGVAKKIPYQVLVNQIFANLLAEYRSAEMGFAIRTIFKFRDKCIFEKCTIGEGFRKNHDSYFVNFNITDYKMNTNICDTTENQKTIHYSETLTCQRRLIDQYFWQVGDLAFGKQYHDYARLTSKFLRNYFTSSEHNLLSIILKMDEIEDEILKKPKREGLMWDIRKKLYEESRNWHL